MVTLAVVTQETALIERLRKHFDAVRVTAEQCDALIARRPPDAYLLDAQRSDLLGLVARLSATHRPIVVLTNGAATTSTMDYLETGADAVLPVASVDECMAHLRALTRRSRMPWGLVETVYYAGDVELYRDSRQVLLRGESVRLTRTEFNLLLALAEHTDQVVPHRKLMSEVWGPEYASARHYLRAYIRRLREKLETDPERPELLVAARGKGYMLASGRNAES